MAFPALFRRVTFPVPDGGVFIRRHGPSHEPTKEFAAMTVHLEHIL